jgi:hypothetical protein
MGRHEYDQRNRGQRVVELSGANFDERERQAAIVAAENGASIKIVRDNLFCAGPLFFILVS